MSNQAQSSRKKTLVVIIVAIIVIAATWGGLYIQNKNSGHVQIATNTQNQITQISYDGKNGINAYKLLTEYATVQAKHYSFGYFVTSINGVVGNGPKYWTFYVNGKEASVGASSYITKNSDKITWKLQ